MLARTFGHALLALVTVAGCSHLRFREAPHTSPGDWRMEGFDSARTNVAPGALGPPLRLAWQYDASAGFGRACASTADSILFVANLQGEVHSVTIGTGSKTGARDFGSAIAGAPVVDRGILYVALAHDEESLLAYNLATSTILWSDRIGGIETSPLLLGSRLYVTTLDGRLVCVDTSNGAVTWTYELPASVRSRTIRSSPASDGTIVVFGSDEGHLYAVGADDGKLRWKAPARASIIATPSIAMGSVLVGSLDSSLYRFDLASGTRRWECPLGAVIAASQATDGEAIYVGTAGRTVYSVSFSDGSVRWHTELGGVINSAPLVSGGVVYLGCLDANLYALDRSNGSTLWKYQADGRIKTSPIESKGHLFVFEEDHTVLAFVREAER